MNFRSLEAVNGALFARRLRRSKTIDSRKTSEKRGFHEERRRSLPSGRRFLVDARDERVRRAAPRSAYVEAAERARPPAAPTKRPEFCAGMAKRAGVRRRQLRFLSLA